MGKFLIALGSFIIYVWLSIILIQLFPSLYSQVSSITSVHDITASMMFVSIIIVSIYSFLVRPLSLRSLKQSIFGNEELVVKNSREVLNMIYFLLLLLFIIIKSFSLFALFYNVTRMDSFMRSVLSGLFLIITLI